MGALKHKYGRHVVVVRPVRPPRIRTSAHMVPNCLHPGLGGADGSSPRVKDVEREAGNVGQFGEKKGFSREPPAIPAKHTAPCLGRRANQVTVLSLHCVISLCSLAGGIQTLVIDDSTDSTYSGTILIVSSVVWAWATVVLLIAPASASCSVPIFWALAFYAEVVTGWLSGCAFWDQHHRGLQVTEAGSTFSMLVLVLLNWRQFAGLTLLPVLLMLLVCQAFI